MTEIQPPRGGITRGPQVSCGSRDARPRDPLPHHTPPEGAPALMPGLGHSSARPGQDKSNTHVQPTRSTYGHMLLELGASTSLRKEAILLAVGSPK